MILLFTIQVVVYTFNNFEANTNLGEHLLYIVVP